MLLHMTVFYEDVLRLNIWQDMAQSSPITFFVQCGNFSFATSLKGITRYFRNPSVHFNCSILQVAAQVMDIFFKAFRVHSSARSHKGLFPALQVLLRVFCGLNVLSAHNLCNPAVPERVTLTPPSFTTSCVLRSEGSSRTDTTIVFCPTPGAPKSIFCIGSLFRMSRQLCILPRSSKNDT